MATKLTESLFPDFAGLLATPTEALRAQPIQAAYADRGDTLGFIRGQIRGAGAEMRQGIGRAFGQEPAAVAQQQKLAAVVQQVQQTGVDLATAEGQVALAQELSKYPEFIGMATAMRQEAAKTSLEAQKAGAEIFQRQAAGTASLAQATRERTPAALEQADRLRLQELQDQFGPVEGARRFRAERDVAGERKAAAGTPQKQMASGIGLRQDFLKEVKPLDDADSALQKAEALLNEQSGLADAIAKRQFAKFAGDRDISNKDVQSFGNFGTLGQRLGGILNQFFEGRYSDAQRLEALRIIKNLRDPIQTQRKTVESQFRSEAKRLEIGDQALDFVVPPKAAVTKVPGTATPSTTGTITLPSGNKAKPLN